MQEDSKHNELHDAFGEKARLKLEHYEVPVDKDCWKDINQQLNPGGGLPTWAVVSAVVVAAAAIVVFLMFMLSAPDNPETGTDIVPQETVDSVTGLKSSDTEMSANEFVNQPAPKGDDTENSTKRPDAISQISDSNILLSTQQNEMVSENTEDTANAVHNPVYERNTDAENTLPTSNGQREAENKSVDPNNAFENVTTGGLPSQTNTGLTNDNDLTAESKQSSVSKPVNDSNLASGSGQSAFQNNTLEDVNINDLPTVSQTNTSQTGLDNDNDFTSKSGQIDVNQPINESDPVGNEQYTSQNNTSEDVNINDLPTVSQTNTSQTGLDNDNALTSKSDQTNVNQPINESDLAVGNEQYTSQNNTSEDVNINDLPTVSQTNTSQRGLANDNDLTTESKQSSVSKPVNGSNLASGSGQSAFQNNTLEDVNINDLPTVSQTNTSQAGLDNDNDLTAKSKQNGSDSLSVNHNHDFTNDNDLTALTGQRETKSASTAGHDASESQSESETIAMNPDYENLLSGEIRENTLSSGQTTLDPHLYNDSIAEDVDEPYINYNKEEKLWRVHAYVSKWWVPEDCEFSSFNIGVGFSYMLGVPEFVGFQYGFTFSKKTFEVDTDDDNLKDRKLTATFLGFPVDVKVRLLHRPKLEVFTTYGLAFDFGIKQITDYRYEENEYQQMVKTNEYPYDEFDVKGSLHVSAGIIWNVYKNFGIYAEPILHYYWDGKSLYRYYPSQTFILGLNMGINYRF